MRLTPRDQEKLMLHTACTVAQKRYARGLKLNYPEAVALISGQLLELIRDGYSLVELTALGRQILGTEEVMPGVPEMTDRVQVEGTLTDGTKLVSVHQPICLKRGNAELALYASGLTPTALYGGKPLPDNSMNVVPGLEELLPEPIAYNTGRKTVRLEVSNTGSRDVQVGSHLRFEKTNKALVFDRKKSTGYRLNIPAGTAVRFAAGETKTVELVEILTVNELTSKQVNEKTS
ncbi:MAG: urease subunit gamma [Dysgonamonadaceae bacterium]|jgi:urease subunit gamma/beta|nr:urease subunit gamma [Dysgonamonadaceae bacterium]